MRHTRMERGFRINSGMSLVNGISLSGQGTIIRFRDYRCWPRTRFARRGGSGREANVVVHAGSPTVHLVAEHPRRWEATRLLVLVPRRWRHENTEIIACATFTVGRS
jgi:hypothetical protein